MKEKITVSKFIRGLKNTRFIQNSNIPLSYSPSLPFITVRNSYLCMIVPFTRYQITGKKDETLVYPLRHCVTVSLPDFTIVSVDDLRFEERLEKVDFGKPVGTFRHEAIKHLNREKYEEIRDSLFCLYDKLIATLTNDDCVNPFTEEDDRSVAKLLRMLLEPSLVPFYRILDKDFCDKYFNEENKL